MITNVLCPPGAEKEIAESGHFKFVVYEDGEKGRAKVMLGEFLGRHHVDLVPADTKFIGGGMIMAIGGHNVVGDDRYAIRVGEGALHAKWDSSSCEEKYGHDRPRDNYEARRVISDVVHLVHKWIKTVMESEI